MTFRESWSDFGCCGLNTRVSDQGLISLFGTVDSEKEVEDWIKASQEQLTWVKDTYPYVKPSYWTWKHPDFDVWYVFYSTSEGSYCYKPRPFSSRKLVPTLSSWKIDNIFPHPAPFGIFIKNKGEAKKTFLVPVDYFGREGKDRFLYRMTLRKRDHPQLTHFKCVFNDLWNKSVVENIQYVRDHFDVVFEHKWHNPGYSCESTELDDNDDHTLLTFIFKEKT